MKADQRLLISRMISRLENREDGVFHELQKYFGAASFKKTVCFTGPAGVGKSSFLALLSRQAAETQKVCWLACDPSSPISGGSFLGDRIRISGQEVPDNLFIRSLSTRSPAAFSKSIRDIQIFLERHFDQVWVETAGTGQTQSEVSQISGLTVLILQPETGDEVQWMKSGLRECVDVFIVNKADLPGAEEMLKSLVELGAPRDRVFLVSTKSRLGIRDFLQALFEIQAGFPWKKRLAHMHEELARSLFFEFGIKKLEKEFQKAQTQWLKNPYRAASKFLS